MKHTLTVSIFLILIFVVSQLIGLALIDMDAQISVSPTGEHVVTHGDTALGERPAIQGGTTTVYIFSAIMIGTVLLLLIIRFKKMGLWKFWYFTAVWATLTVTFGVFLHPLIAGCLGLLFALLKIFKPQVIIHNLTEIAMYSGIALLFVPLLNVFWMIIVLLLISVYDAYAVWKSKHMITMAKFTMESKLFAGLAIPYTQKKIISVAQPSKTGKGRTAILGGGDVAFPLMFSGVVMESLLRNGLTKASAYGFSLIVVLGATAAVTYLLLRGEKGKFYPAMPFITTGCLIGYGIIALLQIIH